MAKKTKLVKSELLILPLVPFLLTGCFITRAQLKDGQYGDAQPAQVEDVQPEGRYVVDEIKTRASTEKTEE